MHHTKDKGDLGVLKAQADLCEQGFMILSPLTEHAPFDLVIYKDGQFQRVQVKYRTQSRHGTLDVAFKSYWSNKAGINVKKQDLNLIDILCIYCPETNECYYVNIADINDICISLRVKAPKNNQTANIRMASDYRRVP